MRARILAAGVAARPLSVVVDDGVAVLSGRVRTLWDKQHATAAAGRIRGVSSVVNDLVVTPPREPDEKIEQRVKAALDADPATHPLSLDVTVQRGKAVVSGEVASFLHKRFVADVVSDVAGVTEIDDRGLSVVLSPRTDSDILAAVKKRLSEDAWVDVRGLDVTVEDGAVVLTGAVGSVAARSRAQLLAYVPGARSVVANLRVDPDLLAHGERDRMPEPDTATMIVRVRGAIERDPRLSGAKIGVHATRGGSLELGGVVPSVAARRAALADAFSVIGVARVVDKLRVHASESRTPARVAARVLNALRRSGRVGAGSIAVAAGTDGAVALNGTVTTPAERWAAEQIAARVPGVTGVDNLLHVGDTTLTPGIPDAEIRRRIESLLRSDTDIDGDAIRVSVTNGRVTLTGTVDDWQQYSNVLETIYGVRLPGSVAIEGLHVEPDPRRLSLESELRHW